jgi:hypothetical protein
MNFDTTINRQHPVGRFVYWTDRKPADLMDGNSRCIAYLDSLPF